VVGIEDGSSGNPPCERCPVTVAADVLFGDVLACALQSVVSPQLWIFWEMELKLERFYSRPLKSD
jgi:hypothetical protein